MYVQSGVFVTDDGWRTDEKQSFRCFQDLRNNSTARLVECDQRHEKRETGTRLNKQQVAFRSCVIQQRPIFYLASCGVRCEQRSAQSSFRRWVDRGARSQLARSQNARRPRSRLEKIKKGGKFFSNYQLVYSSTAYFSSLTTHSTLYRIVQTVFTPLRHNT